MKTSVSAAAIGWLDPEISIPAQAIAGRCRMDRYYFPRSRPVRPGKSRCDGMVDIADLKSVGSNPVPVRVRPAVSFDNERVVNIFEGFFARVFSLVFPIPPQFENENSQFPPRLAKGLPHIPPVLTSLWPVPPLPVPPQTVALLCSLGNNGTELPESFPIGLGWELLRVEL